MHSTNCRRRTVACKSPPESAETDHASRKSLSKACNDPQMMSKVHSDLGHGIEAPGYSPSSHANILASIDRLIEKNTWGKGVRNVLRGKQTSLTRLGDHEARCSSASMLQTVQKIVQCPSPGADQLPINLKTYDLAKQTKNYTDSLSTGLRMFEENRIDSETVFDYNTTKIDVRLDAKSLLGASTRPCRTCWHEQEHICHMFQRNEAVKHCVGGSE